MDLTCFQFISIFMPLLSHETNDSGLSASSSHQFYKLQGKHPLSFLPGLGPSFGCLIQPINLEEGASIQLTGYYYVLSELE
jgi:hypothetical protein